MKVEGVSKLPASSDGIWGSIKAYMMQVPLQGEKYESAEKLRRRARKDRHRKSSVRGVCRHLESDHYSGVAVVVKMGLKWIP